MKSFRGLFRRRLLLTAAVAAISGAALLVAVPGVLTSGPIQNAEILFSGNWETGNISQWSGAQCANTGPVGGSYLRGTINIVTQLAPVAQRIYAARFDLPAGSPASACEVLRDRTEALGTDDWYALEVYFPSNWQEPSSDFWGLLFAQLNYEDLGVGPPVGLYAHADHVNLTVETGLCNEATGACQYTTSNDAGPSKQGSLGYTLRMVPLGTTLAGMWQEFMVHVHWAADSSGLVEGWWRPRGGNWKKTVSWGGYPTVQWTSTQPPETNFGTHDKIGAYRGASTFPISIWQDGFCVAGSFSAAESCL
jgi:hypothetical protein